MSPRFSSTSMTSDETTLKDAIVTTRASNTPIIAFSMPTA